MIEKVKRMLARAIMRTPDAWEGPCQRIYRKKNVDMHTRGESKLLQLFRRQEESL